LFSQTTSFINAFREKDDKGCTCSAKQFETINTPVVYPILYQHACMHATATMKAIHTVCTDNTGNLLVEVATLLPDQNNVTRVEASFLILKFWRDLSLSLNVYIQVLGGRMHDASNSWRGCGLLVK
jgi:hypothetical protein